MPDAPVAGDLGAGQGPNATVPFGQGGAMDALQARLGQGPLGSRHDMMGGPSTPGAGAAPPPGPGPPGAVQPPPPAGQPAPRPPLPQHQPLPTPWRTFIRQAASHPDAGPSLRSLAALTHLDQQ